MNWTMSNHFDRPRILKTEDWDEVFIGPIKRLLDEKWKTRRLAFTRRDGAKQYIDLYERILNRPIIRTGNEKGARQLNA